MLFSFRDFSAGFVVGFGSGVAFRAFANKDFAPLKDVFKTSAGIAQKVGDTFSGSFGRLRESMQDAGFLARRQRAVGSQSAEARTARARPARKTSRERRKAAAHRRTTEYHA